MNTSTQILCALLHIYALFISCSAQNPSTIIDLAGTWKVMAGDNPTYSLPDFDDSAWPKATLPARQLMPSTLFSDKQAAAGIDTTLKKGYVWYRRAFTINEIPNGKLLFQAGEIMNADTVYINGTAIGSSGRFPPEFRSA